MNMVEIIAKKRDGTALTTAEIDWFIDGVTHDSIKDYQISALLMAIVLNGMNAEETVALTLAMAHSGELLDLSDIVPYAVDKHSSGGVGDKTSLVVLPLVAAAGVPVAKMSGRGLGLTGGTLDKLEAISGFNVNLSEDEFRRVAAAHGLVLAGQSGDLAPADGKLYALRDVTATVQSTPLIVSSIMSKKIAAGANGIVLDVKAGSGAFMKTVEDALELAQAMVEIGAQAGRDMIAVVTDMSQPLGEAVGHALEIREVIAALNGGGPHDVREHCLIIAGHMLTLAGQGQRWTDADAVEAELIALLDGGAALAKFREMVAAQGGDVSQVDNPDLLPTAPIIEVVTAEHAGVLARVDAEMVARAAFALGAGRKEKGEKLDLSVGVMVHQKIGSVVQAGQPLFTLHANDAARAQSAREILAGAIGWGEGTVMPPQHIYHTLSACASGS